MSDPVSRHGTAAFGPSRSASGEYLQKGMSGGKDISAAGIYANTWEKRNGRWVVVHSVFP